MSSWLNNGEDSEKPMGSTAIDQEAPVGAEVGIEVVALVDMGEGVAVEEVTVAPAPLIMEAVEEAADP